MVKHWSKVEYLHQTVKNPNIIVKGTKSYYSNAYTKNFEDSAVRYLWGDSYSKKNFAPLWEYDKLYIGNYVCIGAETVILMGGNNTHRVDWFSCYPFMEKIKEAYISKGDTVIADGAWIGMRAMIMPGVHIGEGAIIATGAVVTKDVSPYTIVAGSPAKLVKKRFDDATIKELLALKIYDHSEEEITALIPYLCSQDLNALKNAIINLDNK
ncbi:MAG: CatB-related O-acetyltransferase [Alphaproteobacteria bacterium]|nr:CatB-related O-acetyltransferase [Alphaproteobacteria bacterium]